MHARAVACVALFCALLLSPPAHAGGPLTDESESASATNSPDERRSNEDVEVIEDVDEYVERTRNVVERARAGDYGRIKKRDMDRVAKEQHTIEALLGNRKGGAELTEAEQIQLANAQESINGIIRADDKSRMVCKKTEALGTRIPKTECLSVAKWEQLADTARRVVKTANDFCVPGQGNRCTNASDDVLSKAPSQQ